MILGVLAGCPFKPFKRERRRRCQRKQPIITSTQPTITRRLRITTLRRQSITRRATTKRRLITRRWHTHTVCTLWITHSLRRKSMPNRTAQTQNRAHRDRGCNDPLGSSAHDRSAASQGTTHFTGRYIPISPPGDREPARQPSPPKTAVRHRTEDSR